MRFGLAVSQVIFLFSIYTKKKKKRERERERERKKEKQKQQKTALFVFISNSCLYKINISFSSHPKK